MREISGVGLVRRGSCQHSYRGCRIHTGLCHHSVWCWARLEEQQIPESGTAAMETIGRWTEEAVNLCLIHKEMRGAWASVMCTGQMMRSSTLGTQNWE